MRLSVPGDGSQTKKEKPRAISYNPYVFARGLSAVQRVRKPQYGLCVLAFFTVQTVPLCCGWQRSSTPVVMA